MSNNLDELVVKFGADMTELSNAYNKLSNRQDKFEKQVEKGSSKTEDAFSRVKNAVIGLGAAYSALEFGKKVVRDSIAVEQLENRMLAAVQSSEASAQALKYVSDESERLGLNMLEAGNGFAGFAASATRAGFSLEETEEIFTNVSEAATSLQLSSERMGLVFRALEQIASKGTVQMEELKLQLGDSLPGALEIAARSTGVTTKQFIKMVEQGEVLASEFLPNFSRALKDELGGASKEASQSLQANFNRMENAFVKLSVAVSDTGVGDALKDIVALITKAIEGWTEFVNEISKSSQEEILTDLKNVTDQMSRWEKEIAKLQERVEKGGILGGFAQSQLMAARNTMKDLREEHASLMSQLESVNTPIDTSTSSGESPYSSVPQEEDELTKEQEKIANKIAIIEEGLMTERELLQLHYEEKRRIIEEAELALIGDEENRQTLLDKLNADKQRKEDEISKKEKDRETKTLQNQRNNFASIVSMAGAHNKQMFQLSKAFEVADAVKKGYAATMDAYAWGNKMGGPVLGGAFAATAAAASALYIKQIAGASFGGGGGSVSASGATPVTNVDNFGNPTNTGSDQAQSQPTQVNVNIPNIISGDALRSLIDGLNEQHEAGYTLRVNGAV